MAFITANALRWKNLMTANDLLQSPDERRQRIFG